MMFTSLTRALRSGAHRVLLMGSDIPGNFHLSTSYFDSSSQEEEEEKIPIKRRVNEGGLVLVSEEV